MKLEDGSEEETYEAYRRCFVSKTVDKSPMTTNVLCDELYDNIWYIESGCSRHMTGKKENLRYFQSLKNAGVVKFGNNQKCEVKGYGKNHKWKIYSKSSGVC